MPYYKINEDLFFLEEELEEIAERVGDDNVRITEYIEINGQFINQSEDYAPDYSIDKK